MNTKIYSGLINLILTILRNRLKRSFTYIATILIVMQAGHIPVLAEPDISTYNIDLINKHKREPAFNYHNNLKKDFILPVLQDGFYDVFHIYNIRHEKRDNLKEYLKSNDIIAEIHYPLPPDKQKALSFLSGLNFPVSEEIHNTTLSLPNSTIHSKDDIYRVVDVLNRF